MKEKEKKKKKERNQKLHFESKKQYLMCKKFLPAFFSADTVFKVSE